MWPFKKKQKDSDAAAYTYTTDAIIHKAFMGNQEAWEKILNEESKTILEAAIGSAMSFTIIHRWGEKSEKERIFAVHHFIDFVIGKHSNSNRLPNILDDDRLWKSNTRYRKRLCQTAT